MQFVKVISLFIFLFNSSIFAFVCDEDLDDQISSKKVVSSRDFRRFQSRCVETREVLKEASTLDPKGAQNLASCFSCIYNNGTLLPDVTRRKECKVSCKGVYFKGKVEDAFSLYKKARDDIGNRGDALQLSPNTAISNLSIPGLPTDFFENIPQPCDEGSICQDGLCKTCPEGFEFNSQFGVCVGSCLENERVEILTSSMTNPESRCVPCGEDQIVSNDGLSCIGNCLPADNKFNDPNDESLCIQCPANSEVDLLATGVAQDYSKACTCNDPNSVYRFESNTCQSCGEEATFKTIVDGDQIIQRCECNAAAHEFNIDDNGSPVCKSCLGDGLAFDEQTKRCSPCPTGSIVNQTTFECEACQIDFEPNEAKTKCEPIAPLQCLDPDTYADKNNKKCLSCGDGRTYSYDLNRCVEKNCLNKDNIKINPDGSCGKECPAGSIITESGDCQCPEGLFLSSTLSKCISPFSVGASLFIDVIECGVDIPNTVLDNRFRCRQPWKDWLGTSSGASYQVDDIFDCPKANQMKHNLASGYTADGGRTIVQPEYACIDVCPSNLVAVRGSSGCQCPKGYVATGEELYSYSYTIKSYNSGEVTSTYTVPVANKPVPTCRKLTADDFGVNIDMYLFQATQNSTPDIIFERCGANRVSDGTACYRCVGNQVFENGQCVDCTERMNNLGFTGLYRADELNSGCYKCPEYSTEVIGSQCNCPNNGKYNFNPETNNCELETCPQNEVLVEDSNGTFSCACAEGFRDEGGQCQPFTCTAPEVISGNECICSEETVFDNFDREVRKYIVFNGECVESPEARCSDNEGTVYDPSLNKCVCDSGSGYDNYENRTNYDGSPLCELSQKETCEQFNYGYNEETNRCVSCFTFGEVVDLETNQCVCDTDNGFYGEAGSCTQCGPNQIYRTTSGFEGCICDSSNGFGDLYGNGDCVRICPTFDGDPNATTYNTVTGKCEDNGI